MYVTNTNNFIFFLPWWCFSCCATARGAARMTPTANAAAAALQKLSRTDPDILGTIQQPITSSIPSTAHSKNHTPMLNMALIIIIILRLTGPAQLSLMLLLVVGQPSQLQLGNQEKAQLVCNALYRYKHTHTHKLVLSSTLAYSLEREREKKKFPLSFARKLLHVRGSYALLSYVLR